jgi:transcriptional regulator with XRE-family HTH domain
LAEASGISRVTLSNWRNGRHAPTLEAFLTVEDTLSQMIAERTNG